MKFSFGKEVYGKRSLVEAVNSMIKRKMSGTVYGRTEWARDAEVMCRCIAHNIRRMLAFGVEV